MVVARPSVGRHKEAGSSSSHTIPGREYTLPVRRGELLWPREAHGVGTESDRRRPRSTRLITDGVATHRFSHYRRKQRQYLLAHRTDTWRTNNRCGGAWAERPAIWQERRRGPRRARSETATKRRRTHSCCAPQSASEGCAVDRVDFLSPDTNAQSAHAMKTTSSASAMPTDCPSRM